MKKLFFAIAAILTATTVFATNPTTANDKILNQFKNTFTGASDVKVTSRPAFVDVSYIENGEQAHAYYKHSGELVGTSKAIEIEDLPTSAKRQFAKKYTGYTVKEAFLFEGEDEAAYYISAEKDDLSVVLKVSEAGYVSVYKKSNKNK